MCTTELQCLQQIEDAVGYGDGVGYNVQDVLAGDVEYALAATRQSTARLVDVNTKLDAMKTQFDNSIFMLQVNGIGLCLIWAALTWRLICYAKSSRDLW